MRRSITVKEKRHIELIIELIDTFSRQPSMRNLEDIYSKLNEYPGRNSKEFTCFFNAIFLNSGEYDNRCRHCAFKREPLVSMVGATQTGLCLNFNQDLTTLYDNLPVLIVALLEIAGTMKTKLP